VQSSVGGLARALKRQEALTTLATAVAVGRPGSEICRTACDAAVQVTGARAAWLCAVEGEHVRVLAASRSESPLLPAPGQLYQPPEDSDMMRALRAGEVVLVEPASDAAVPSRLSGFAPPSGCVVPVLRHGSLWGVLCVAAAGPGRLELPADAVGQVRELLQHADLSDLSDPSSSTGTEPAAALPEERSYLWQRTLDSLTRHVAILDGRGVIVAVNEAWTSFASANSGNASTGLGANYLSVCRAAMAAGVAEAADVVQGLHELLDGRRELFETEYACHGPAEQRWFAMRATAMEERGQRHLIVQHENITTRHKAEVHARRQAQLLDEIDAAVICTDLDGVVTLWNTAAERLYGWTSEEATGCAMTELASGAADAQLIGTMLATLREHGRWEGEKEVQDRHGRGFTCGMRNSLIIDGDGSPIGVIGISLDITERKVHERNLEASRDYLRAITSSITDGLLALNDDGLVIYGNAAAVKLLRRPAETLVGAPVAAVLGLRPSEVSAIITADTPVHMEEDCFNRADGTRLPVAWTASPLKGGPYGEGRVLVFRDITADQHELARRATETARARWAARLRESVSEQRFELFAQPILNLRTRRVSGSELLIRMHDEDGTLVYPDAFLPAAEKHGLMNIIDRWVVQEGIKLAAGGMPVHLNLSAQSIGDPDVLEELERRLRQMPAAIANLTLELTETALTIDWKAATHFSRATRALGLRLALDDFGTGHNSFRNFKQIAVDEIKIDKQFVRDLLQAPASESVVKAVVSMAADLRLQTVAEGVEDAPTLARLRELGVDHAQGYHIGRPAPMRF
ncbi:MAG: hypothetical protein JWM31_2376, partial [Solirubrobacterales bacterium]|nr:hypothetical protein [Solirubrobacterales bacterium]